mgnify:CR=1 FL=1
MNKTNATFPTISPGNETEDHWASKGFWQYCDNEECDKIEFSKQAGMY